MEKHGEREKGQRGKLKHMENITKIGKGTKHVRRQQGEM